MERKFESNEKRSNQEKMIFQNTQNARNRSPYAQHRVMRYFYFFASTKLKILRYISIKSKFRQPNCQLFFHSDNSTTSCKKHSWRMENNCKRCNCRKQSRRKILFNSNCQNRAMFWTW